jgi:L-ascorbate metabolism protein UlaG (beta-lactamase superfamily)
MGRRNSIPPRLYANGTQMRRFILILFALGSVSACHASYEPYAKCELPVSDGKAPLTARFFGVSTILLSDGQTAVMTDGFFSRPPASQFLISKIAPDPTRIDKALAAGGVDNLAALLVAHSHYDHALDSARVAWKTGALLVGSESTAIIARGEEFPESRIIVIRGDETIVLQPFTIAVFESPHSTGTPGEHKRQGTIKAPFHSPAHYDDYKEGGSYSFLIELGGFRTLVHASANFRKGMYDGVRADVVFLGIGTLGKKPDRFVKDYWDEVVGKTQARLVIPVHWDDFSIALDEKKPLRPASLPIEDFRMAMKMLRPLSTDKVAMRFMPLFQPVDLMAAAGLPADGPPSVLPSNAPTSSCP